MKQVILVREDLGLSKGKLASQVSHASVESVLRSDKNRVEDWRREGSKKIVLRVKDEKELIKYYKEAKKNKLVSVLIKDMGLTEVKPGTKTCIGIGPDEDKKIDKVTGKLKVL